MKKNFAILMVVMLISLVVAGLWDKVPVIKEIVNSIFNPILNPLLNWNISIGFIIITFFVTLATTLIQKYATDQEALKGLKDQQKSLQEEMKVNKDNPSKMMELQKRQFEHLPKTFELTMKPLMYTAIPLILLFRWFSDTFKNLGDPEILGLLGWLWAYIILSIIFSTILRKILKVH